LAAAPAAWRHQVGRGNRVGDAKLVAERLAYELLECRGIGFPAEPADALVAERIAHNVGAALAGA
jgi:S-adenosylmethionine synthetase